VERRIVLKAGLVLGALPWLRLARAGAPDGLAVHLSSPQDLGTAIGAFDQLITPTRLFFVRSHFGPPALRPNRRLRVTGLVENPLDLTVAALRRFDEVSITSVLECAGNGRGLHEPHVPGVQWQHGAMGQALWTGVRLRDVLAHARVRGPAAHVGFAGADLPPKPTVPRFARGFPLARATDPSTILAYRMNGEPLPLEHGAPIRLVVPGWSGNHWVKWLTNIELRDRPAEGFFMEKGYRWPTPPVAPGQAVGNSVPVTTLPVRSVIARPVEGTVTARGAQEIVGVAFSGAAAVARVELSVDGGDSFTPCALEGEPGVGRWQVFRHRFYARAPGRYRATVRATDRAGVTQPRTAIWNPSGYFWNAWHTVEWSVA
jgi:DMSO/TMAO reductase YedYZ molybdopterin-dependent catalytic subunit